MNDSRTQPTSHYDMDKSETSSDGAAALVPPDLEAFFDEEPIKISAFLRALKVAQRRRFEAPDIEAAEAKISKNDPEGARLWLLVSNARQSDAISGWLWPYAMRRIGETVGAGMDVAEMGPADVLNAVIETLSPGLHCSDKHRFKAAQFQLRLTLLWLLEKRNLDPVLAAEALRPLFDHAGAADRELRRTLARGSLQEIKAVVTALTLSDQKLRAALTDRDSERRQKLDLRIRLESSEKKQQENALRIAALENECSRLLEVSRAERKRSENADKHHGHDLTEMKAYFRVFMGERLTTLLGDAFDGLAIEIERSGQNGVTGLRVAQRRIRNALDEIEEALR